VSRRKALASRPQSENAIAEYIVQLAHAGNGRMLGSELKLSQWMALRYFGRANRFSRTVSAFAHYQGTTRGTASHTLKVLLKRGYLSRQPDERDHRSFRLELSWRAREVLHTDPLAHLVEAAQALSAGGRTEVASGLEAMLLSLKHRFGTPLFGSCCSCKYLGDRRLCRNSPYECTLLHEPLNRDETVELCVNYHAANS
jgi:DNA-binding MarR family transcriptional regulator